MSTVTAISPGHPVWVAVDWGTSHLRVWLMGAGGEVLEHRKSARGMGGLTPAAYEPALLDLIGDRLVEGRATPIIVCGMAGSRQGWAEAAYATVPVAPLRAEAALRVATRDPRLRVFILPGLKQTAPPDVMRGEECQIAGLMAAEPGFDGIVCLPGTHTKWAHVSAGEVVSFRTFMTGEMFALLSKQSVLRHAVAESGWHAEAFASGLQDAMSRPASIAAELFTIRAATLLEGRDGAEMRARLSGLLIGIELAAARPYWLGQEVRVVGDAGIADAYIAALESQGVMVKGCAATDMTLAGLAAGFAALQESVA